MSDFWLGLDTATEIASVAAGRPPVAQSGAHVQGVRRHAAEIIRLVDFALSRQSIRPADLAGLVGDGAVRYAGEVTRWIGTAPLPLESLPPAATMLLALVHREGTGRAIEDPVTAEPVYGRPAEAQARWEARHGRPLPDSPRPAG